MKKLINFILCLFKKKDKPGLAIEFPKYELQTIDYEIIGAINYYRETLNIETVGVHNKLTDVSNSHSQYMALQNKKSHDNFIVRANQFSKNNVGEIVAFGYNTPASIVNAWKNSSNHNQIMTNSKYKNIGLTTCKSSTGKLYVCCLFMD